MKLYGGPMSNYYNMAKHAMLEKGLSFEEVETRPNQEPEYLLKSPMGKVPMLETEQGFLTETDAIFDYIEEVFPQPPLFPRDPWERAKVRQVMKVQELYVETPIHNLVGVMFNREVPQHVKDASMPAAKRGLAALGRLVQFNPWLCGAEFSAADIFVFYSFTLSNRLSQQVYGWDLLQELPGLAQWNQRFMERPVCKTVMQANQAAFAAFAKRAKS